MVVIFHRGERRSRTRNTNTAMPNDISSAVFLRFHLLLIRHYAQTFIG